MLISDLPVFTAWSLYASPTKRIGICSFHQKLVPFPRGFAAVSLRVNQFLIVHSPRVLFSDIYRSSRRRTSNTFAVNKRALLCTFSRLHLVRILAVVKWFNFFPINSFLSPSIQPSVRSLLWIIFSQHAVQDLTCLSSRDVMQRGLAGRETKSVLTL